MIFFIFFDIPLLVFVRISLAIPACLVIPALELSISSERREKNIEATYISAN